MAYSSMSPADFPEPVDLTHHLSRSTRAREASSVKQFYKYFTIPGIAQLAGGMHTLFGDTACSGRLLTTA